MVWQLAAISLALSVVVDDSLRGPEAIEVAAGMWFIATALSAPLPIWLAVERFRDRKQNPKSTR